jgi:hypothetical protein
MVEVQVGLEERTVRAGFGAVHADRRGLGVRVVIVGLRIRVHDDRHAPFGDITSFTKNAVSDIIGPQPASYQPTEPSSNSTCKWP